MLGNQKFLAGNFEGAIPLLEKVLIKHPDDAHSIRKLVICYLATGQLYRAIPQFISLLQSDQTLTTQFCEEDSTGLEREIFSTLTSSFKVGFNPAEQNLAAGILAMFFDCQLAQSFFKRARKSDPDDENTQKILDILQFKKSIPE
ncbi:MAG: tetratricopeptide repeat protein [Deferribacteres bacterium]|nr:tetratricopeptide repeat protein [candidate division KSB1 bacterium]MCB9500447.1 tetratricopeptide repeat protein [Deferribacteres bacterium]